MPQTLLSPNKTALIVIDMQKKSLEGKDPFFAEFQELVRSELLIENNAVLIAAVRDAGMPVVFARNSNRRDLSDATPIIRDMVRAKEMHDYENTPEAEIVDKLKPLDSDYIVRKRRSGAFTNTDLELLLRVQNVDTLLITGIMTGACVATTVIQARERDFNVIVVSDCCASMTKERHDHWMKNEFPRSGRVRTMAQVITAVNSLKK